MSIAKFNTLQNAAGTKSVPVDTVVDGSAKAWVNFNGTGTVAIRAAFNVSSITDNGVGDYTVNFATAMLDANYGVTLGGNGNNSVAAPFIGPGLASDVEQTTTSVRVYNYRSDVSGGIDSARLCVAIFR